MKETRDRSRNIYIYIYVVRFRVIERKMEKLEYSRFYAILTYHERNKNAWDISFHINRSDQFIIPSARFIFNSDLGGNRSNNASDLVAWGKYSIEELHFYRVLWKKKKKIAWKTTAHRLYLDWVNSNWSYFTLRCTWFDVRETMVGWNERGGTI